MGHSKCCKISATYYNLFTENAIAQQMHTCCVTLVSTFEPGGRCVPIQKQTHYVEPNAVLIAEGDPEGPNNRSWSTVCENTSALRRMSTLPGTPNSGSVHVRLDRCFHSLSNATKHDGMFDMILRNTNTSILCIFLWLQFICLIHFRVSCAASPPTWSMTGLKDEWNRRRHHAFIITGVFELHREAYPFCRMVQFWS